MVSSGPQRIILASRSPRRLKMLREAGYEVDVVVGDFDDAVMGDRPRDVSPESWVVMLAEHKAEAARAELVRRGNAKADRVILAADTVCVMEEDDILGQPRDASHARAMLRRLRNASHRTITGVCLLSPDGRRRESFVDATIVRVGDVSDAETEAYVASGDWRGKAGAYNLSERLDAGWPIVVEGDPATVMGLPMMRLREALRSFSRVERV